MGTIQRPRLACNPRNPSEERDIFDGNDVLASIDTLILFSARWPKGTLAKVNELQRGLQPSWFDRCENSEGYCWGWTLTVQQPRRETLLLLGRDQNRYKIKVSRIDVAYDVISGNEERKRAKTAWLRGHVLLLYRRKAYLREDEYTINWIEQMGRKSRSNKDIKLYDDQPCKLDGQVDCSHIEIKLYNARTIQGLGMADIGELVDLDPHELFAKLVKLTAFDLKEYVNLCIRRSFRSALMKRRHSKFAEYWNANVHRRLRTIMDKTFQHSAQRAKDILGDKRVCRHTISIDKLHLPNALSWPLSSSSSSKSRLSVLSHRLRHRVLKTHTVISKRGMDGTLT